LFNTKENQTYIGPLSDAQYYSEQMKPADREQFLEMTRKNIIFDFQRKIVQYCHNDVDIPQRACMTFRKIFLERGNVCPFKECTTIASMRMKVFRKNFLRERNRNHSIEQIQAQG